jgi:hypothetical protein
MAKSCTHLVVDQTPVGFFGSVIEEQVYREDAPGNAVVARARRWRPPSETITKATCLTGRKSRAGPALQNGAF